MTDPPSKDSDETWPWPLTEWSASGRLPSSLGRDATRLNELILKYQTPLKAYLLAAFPGIQNEADELLQDFTQDRILKEGWLGKAERNRGRFRDFLKISLKNFVRDRLRARADATVSLDELEMDLPAKEKGNEAFGLEWARTILTEVLRRMELDCRTPHRNESNRYQIWETFRTRLLQPILEGAEPMGYEELVSKLGIASPFAAQNLLATAKRIFSRHLNAVISEYEGQSEAATAELQDLRQFLAGLTRGKKE
jgi:hypothetical protein